MGEMQIIDFIRKGNVVRFLLGDANGDYWGDDWDDAPYDCNAGEVYDRYVKGHRDIIFPFDDLVLEPCDGEYGDTWVTKEDMKARHVPCIIVVPKALYEDTYKDAFRDWVGADGIQKFFFGDTMEPEKEEDEMESEKDEVRERKTVRGIPLAELVKLMANNADSKEEEAILRFLLRNNKDAMRGNVVTLHGVLVLIKCNAISPEKAELILKKFFGCKEGEI